jgi:hypothetical protein
LRLHAGTWPLLLEGRRGCQRLRLHAGTWPLSLGCRRGGQRHCGVVVVVVVMVVLAVDNDVTGAVDETAPAGTDVLGCI